MASIYDYYEDDDGYTYDDYLPKTHDPGQWMLVGVGLYSLLCLFALPFLVVCGNRREKGRLNRKEWEKIQMDQKDVDASSIDTKADVDHPESIIIESDDNDIEIVLKDDSTNDGNESIHSIIQNEECKRFCDDEERKAGSLFLSSNASMTDSMVDARSLDAEVSVSH